MSCAVGCDDDEVVKRQSHEDSSWIGKGSPKSPAVATSNDMSLVTSFSSKGSNVGKVGVSSITTGVGVSPGTTGVGVSSITSKSPCSMSINVSPGTTGVGVSPKVNGSFTVTYDYSAEQDVDNTHRPMEELAELFSFQV